MYDPIKFAIVLALNLLLITASARPAPGTSPWTRHPSIGLGPRQEHAVVTADENIYVLGGVATDFNSTLNTINSVEVYDTKQNTWSVAAPLPAPLNHANAAVVDGKVYVLGALSSGSAWNAVGDAYVYDPYFDLWTQLPSLPSGTARGASAVGVWNQSIYVAGGMTYIRYLENGKQDAVAVVSVFNTGDQTWSELPPLPQPRQHVGGAVVGSMFYVLGGREDGTDKVQGTVFALDLLNPTRWESKASMPTPRGSISCSTIDLKIYCFGGEGNLEPGSNGVFGNVEVYDTVSDSWQELVKMEVPRHGTGSATVAGKIWIPGGGVYTAAQPVGIMDSFTP